MELTFLELVQAAHRHAGLVGSGPASVLNQSGRNYDVVQAVLEAHEEIQTADVDWNFDWQEVSFYLEIGDVMVDPITEMLIVGGVKKFVRDSAYAYPSASGVSARLFLHYAEWEMFRKLAVPPTSGNQVTHWCVRPDGLVGFWPTPTVQNRVFMEFFYNPQVLAADSTVPRMPDWTHMAIVWKAVMRLAEKTKDWARLDSAEENYQRLYQRMLRECTPQVQAFTEPMA